MSDEVVKADLFTKEGIAIVPLSVWRKWERWTLFAVIAGLFFVGFLASREAAERERVFKKLANQHETATSQLRKDTSAFRDELAQVKKDKVNLKKIQLEATALRNELSDESKKTRTMLFNAWQDHDARLKALTKQLSDIEKRLEKK